MPLLQLVCHTLLSPLVAPLVTPPLSPHTVFSFYLVCWYLWWFSCMSSQKLQEIGIDKLLTGFSPTKNNAFHRLNYRRYQWLFIQFCAYCLILMIFGIVLLQLSSVCTGKILTVFIIMPIPNFIEHCLPYTSIVSTKCYANS